MDGSTVFVDVVFTTGAHVRPGGQDYVHEHRRPVHPKVKNVQIREILAKLQEIEDGMWN